MIPAVAHSAEKAEADRFITQLPGSCQGCVTSAAGAGHGPENTSVRAEIDQLVPDLFEFLEPGPGIQLRKYGTDPPTHDGQDL